MVVWKCVLAVAAGITLVGAMPFGTGVSAQNYPSRPVKIVLPFPAGGPLDFTGRLLADKLAASMKQPFVVENRPGASGNIGTDAVAKADPDGYTLGLGSVAPLAVAPSVHQKLPYDPARDFTFVSSLWQVPNILRLLAVWNG